MGAHPKLIDAAFISARADLHAGAEVICNFS